MADQDGRLQRTVNAKVVEISRERNIRVEFPWDNRSENVEFRLSGMAVRLGEQLELLINLAPDGKSPVIVSARRLRQ
ncbi:hypothetical protein KBD71_03225 [Candidatus Woesebacteria bacterium]|nr:hypothetical protein [Candidatus Woesebacteria bacterium]